MHLTLVFKTENRGQERQSIEDEKLPDGEQRELKQELCSSGKWKHKNGKRADTSSKRWGHDAVKQLNVLDPDQ